MGQTYDAVVIGSGTAGTSAAMALRKGGRTVAVIDERPFGGTCALRGCDPKKVLVAAARSIEDAARWKRAGVFNEQPKIDWQKLIAFKRTFTDPVPDERVKRFRDAGIVPIFGRAAFQSERVLTVGNERIEARNVVIAAGAEELHVADGDDQLLTSETFLEMDSLPESIVFVGGGYIAFEFAHIVASAGASVSVLNNDSTPLHGFDRDLVEHLVRLTRERGIDVHLDTAVKKVQRTDDGVVLEASTPDGPRSFRAAAGVLAAGRVPNLDHLNLEAANVDCTKKGVKVNAFLQSESNAAVYAVGDAADGGGVPLTPVASYEGELAARNILEGNSTLPDFAGLVSIVYTDPPLAMVGETGDANLIDMSTWYSAGHVAAHVALAKIFVDQASGKVRGASVLAHDAEEKINVIALAIRNGLRADGIRDALFGYPTASSDFSEML